MSATPRRQPAGPSDCGWCSSCWCSPRSHGCSRKNTGRTSTDASCAAVMTLFSAPDEAASHRTRIVLAEKDVEIEIVSVTPGRFPEDLLDLNPDHSLPTLVDRDLVLYDSRIIIEYLDERFPHPPLMPVDPVSRAQFRLALHRIERDWYGLAAQLDKQGPDSADAPRLRGELRDFIVQTADFVRNKPYFVSDELSL